MIHTQKSATIAVGVMFAGAVYMAIYYTFFKPNFFFSCSNISIAFLFYFCLKNPGLLSSEISEQLNEEMEKAQGWKYFFGTTPILPALILVAISYIAYAKYGWPL